MTGVQTCALPICCHLGNFVTIGERGAEVAADLGQFGRVRRRVMGRLTVGLDRFIQVGQFPGAAVAIVQRVAQVVQPLAMYRGVARWGGHRATACLQGLADVIFPAVGQVADAQRAAQRRAIPAVLRSI